MGGGGVSEKLRNDISRSKYRYVTLSLQLAGLGRQPILHKNV